MAGGYQSESYLESLRVQCGEDGVGRRNSRPIAFQSDIRAFGIAGD